MVVSRRNGRNDPLRVRRGGALPAAGRRRFPYAQDLNALEGKVVRLNLDGSTPSDNPFFGQAGKRGEIFAYGFR